MDIVNQRSKQIQLLRVANEMDKRVLCQHKELCHDQWNQTGFFRVYTGCRQGDPLSPYLFLLGVEILGRKLSKSKHIRGVSTKDGELRNFYYADDCSIFLHPDNNNLRNILCVFEKCQAFSGLKVNSGKTNVMCIGPTAEIRNLAELAERTILGVRYSLYY